MFNWMGAYQATTNFTSYTSLYPRIIQCLKLPSYLQIKPLRNTKLLKWQLQKIFLFRDNWTQCTSAPHASRHETSQDNQYLHLFLFDSAVSCVYSWILCFYICCDTIYITTLKYSIYITVQKSKTKHGTKKAFPL